MRLRSYERAYFSATECNGNQKHLPRLPTFMNYVQQLQLQQSCNNQAHKRRQRLLRASAVSSILNALSIRVRSERAGESVQFNCCGINKLTAVSKSIVQYIYATPSITTTRLGME